MDKLTYRVGSGAANLYKIDEAKADEYKKSAARQQAFDRLAAYEDTGLEPEEIVQLKEWWRQIPAKTKDEIKTICGDEFFQPPKGENHG